MKRLLILFLGVLLTASLSSQQRITGIVLTADNEPVVGASVSIEGTTLGTVTDNEGRFEIRADNGKNLVVSFVGFETQTITLSSTGNTELRIVLKQQKDKKVSQTDNRFAIWGEFGMSIQPEAFDNNEKFEQYNCVGGGIGFGYQLHHKYLLMTTGVELASINYHVQYSISGSYSSNALDLDCRRLQLQVPILLGMEMKHWYWQTGVKFGFFSYYYLFNKHENIDSKDFNKPYGPVFAFAPSFEIGYNETGVGRVNYKVAAFVEPYFDVLDEMPKSSNAESTQSSTGTQFYYLLFGLKFGIGF